MAKKVLVSFDERLLRAVDRAAEKAGLTRSGYLARLARRELGERGPGASAAARAALARLDRLFARAPRIKEDITAGIRADRDAR